jgi:Glycosyl transferase family 2
MDRSRGAGAVTLSYLVPAHNSTDVIESSLKELCERLAGTGAEILVVENGSSDGSLDLLRRIEREWSEEVALRVLSCPKGLGNALRAGIAASRGDRVFFGADDLPFGFDDLDAALELDHTEHPVVIGSKGHRDSTITRSVSRTILTAGFLILRWLILGMRTRDPQGTFVLDGEWVRAAGPLLAEQGFLLTTELTYIAERSGIKPVEVPVRLRPTHDAHGSRIRLSDPLKMGAGLFGLRLRHRRSLVAKPA